jgi:hypothetical protein
VSFFLFPPSSPLFPLLIFYLTIPFSIHSMPKVSLSLRWLQLSVL